VADLLIHGKHPSLPSQMTFRKTREINNAYLHLAKALYISRTNQSIETAHKLTVSLIANMWFVANICRGPL
jgi:hypothetical protein